MGSFCLWNFDFDYSVRVLEFGVNLTLDSVGRYHLKEEKKSSGALCDHHRHPIYRPI